MKFQIRKNKIYILSVIFILAVVLLLAFGVWPLMSQIGQASQDLLSQKNEVAILMAESDQIESFKKVYDDYKPNLEKVGAMFIDPQNPVDFIKFLEQAGANTSAKTHISLAPTDPQAPNNIMSFFILSSGSFTDIFHFTEQLENGPYLIHIQTLSLKNADTDTTSKNYTPSGLIDASFLINVFTK